MRGRYPRSSSSLGPSREVQTRSGTYGWPARARRADHPRPGQASIEVLSPTWDSCTLRGLARSLSGMTKESTPLS
ncbi:MAG: hypothetical protein JWP31_2269 [Aeromicrobium sp.]|nr:hypothetical protein [Aeromicrobium sp.]